jgi:hypothetical protein
LVGKFPWNFSRIAFCVQPIDWHASCSGTESLNAGLFARVAGVGSDLLILLIYMNFVGEWRSVQGLEGLFCARKDSFRDSFFLRAHCSFFDQGSVKDAGGRFRFMRSIFDGSMESDSSMCDSRLQGDPAVCRMAQERRNAANSGG